jgi:hypothetical protein
MSSTKKLVDAFGRSIEDKREAKQLAEAANLEAQENWHNPTWRAEFAADLTESILLGFETETLVDTLVESETTDFNGRVFVREATGLKAFWMARGGYIEASELSAEVVEVPRDMLGVHVWEFDDKFVNNFSDSARTLRDLAIQRMDAEINRRVHTTLSAAVTGANAISAAGLSAASLNKAIREVADESTTGEVTIFGRPTMVDQITDFTGFGNETLEEIRQKGVLGVYRGAQVVRLRNFKDEDNLPYIPANELWVLSRDCGKMAFFGGMKSKEFEDLDNWYWHYIARRDLGLLIHHPERARKITDTSI